ncbi:hypothetical protein FN846DRAFT_980205 [Sphaerosporella brunnea]|uniref:Uncharacterized protein n=1 Tax=Sphaerosporella brunnea TaxID=1250544 RepID=A0A5J5EDW0_9PEZI|nr:hypothetical protein FN846DRAFT_980205 [Sphaerosporella brunnea]
MSSTLLNPTVTDANYDDRSFRTITKLLHVLQNPNLFVGPSVTVQSIKYTPHKLNSETRRQLKVLRQIPFILVRNNETIAALPRELPGGIVGVLSSTVPSDQEQNDGLINISRNNRDSDKFATFSVHAVPPDTPIPNDILMHVFANWNTSFEEHCDLTAALIHSLFNPPRGSKEELSEHINKAMSRLFKYLHAECGQKLLRRFTRARLATDENAPHYLEVLKDLLSTRRIHEIGFRGLVERRFPHDQRRGWRELVRMSPIETRWFTQNWSLLDKEGCGPAEEITRIQSAIKSLDSFIGRVESEDPSLDDELPDLVPQVYHEFLAYSVSLISLFEYHLKQVVANRFKFKNREYHAPDDSNYDTFRMHCNHLTILSARTAGLAWHSPFWNRLLAFVDLELSFLNEKRKQEGIISTLNGKPSALQGPQPPWDLDLDQGDDDDTTEYILFMNEKKVSHSANSDIFSDNPIAASGNSMGRKIFLWWRLVTFHIESVHNWAKMISKPTATRIPQLSFSIVRTPNPDHGSDAPWRPLIRNLTGSDNTARALEHYLSEAGKKRLDKSFRGHYHCEAIMSSLLCAASAPQNSLGDSDSGLQDVLETLKGAKPVMGTSKRCCHVCCTVMVCLGQHYGQDIPILDFHQSITLYLLPPLLPAEVRRTVVDHYREQLTSILNEVTEAYMDNINADLGSHISPDSASVSSEGDEGHWDSLEEYYEV